MFGLLLCSVMVYEDGGVDFKICKKHNMTQYSGINPISHLKDYDFPV